MQETMYLLKFLLITILCALNVLGKNVISDLPDPPRADPSQCKLVPVNERLDCFPQANANQQDCEQRGCCWLPPQNLGGLPSVPYCFYQPKAPSYTFRNITERTDGVDAILQRSYRSPYPSDVQTLNFAVDYINDTVLRIKITDSSSQRFESFYPELELDNRGTKNPLYQLSIGEDEQGFKVIRKSDNISIFDASDLSNFIYSNQFLQMTTKLPSKTIYGLGEQKKRFPLSTEWQQITSFNHDAAPTLNLNGYGTHPFYLLIENSTKSHGVFLKNSNGMEFVLQPTPALTYRTLGGVLDFLIFLGPTPSDVLKQYHSIIGKPVMPPYWSLGFHLCRYGIGDLNATKKVLKRNLDAGIFVETQWNDLDYMSKHNDFTYDNVTFNGLPEFVKELHEQGRRYIVLVDPGVSGTEDPGTYPPLDRGIEMDVFIKKADGSLFKGKVWNYNSTVFPDFTHPNATSYWKEMLKNFHDIIPIDGVWIDMNEPSNDVIPDGCPDSELEKPFYSLNVNVDTLSGKTLCLTAKQYKGIQYNLHNLYGISEGEVTRRAMDEILGKRSLIISRATFAGQGRYTGHWSGDIYSSWDDMRYTIPTLLDFSLYGIPMMGADICGFNDDSTEELCNRWMQLGAFYPFSRNHNTIDKRDQDPAVWGEQVIRSSVKALTIRYSLLPYLYTLFWQANQEGTTVARPLAIEFPEDPNTYGIDTSFLWGSGLLIAPVLEDNVASLSVYLPQGVWYDYYTRNAFVSNGEYLNFATDKDTIPLFIRGGQVITTQFPANTTEGVRKSMLRIVAAPDEKQNAKGIFYWDDGESLDVGDNFTVLEYSLESEWINIRTRHEGSTPVPEIYSMEVLGVDMKSSHGNFNSNKNYTYRYNKKNQNLLIENLNIRSFPARIRLF